MLRRALEIDPDWPEAYHSLANLQSARGRVQEARILLDRFSELNRRAARVRALQMQLNQAAGGLDSYLAAGRSYGELGRWQEAAGMYRAVLEREPGHVGALAGLSHACLNRGDLDEAVTLARQVISLAPGRREACEAHYTIGYAAARDRRLHRARQAFEQALGWTRPLPRRTTPWATWPCSRGARPRPSGPTGPPAATGRTGPIPR